MTSRLLLGVLLLTVHVTADSDTVSACEGAHCAAMVEEDSADLNLLQRKAQVIRKPTMLDAKPVVEVAKDPALVEVAKKPVAQAAVEQPKAVAGSGHIQDKLQHSITSAFVSAIRSKPAALTHKQRLAMLSTTEASELSETTKQLLIGACVFVALLAGMIIVVVNVIEVKYGRIFGEIVQEGIETIAKDILGLDVTTGSVSIGIMEGKVMITDLKVANPPNCKTDSFLNSNQVDVRLNLWSLVWKQFFGKTDNIEVDSVAFKDVNLNFEKSATTSNAQDILDKVMKPNEDLKLKNNAKKCKLKLHKMTIADAGATVPFWGRVAVPTVQCKDFDMATEGRARALHPIVVEILQEFCQTGEWAGGVAQASPDNKPSNIIKASLEEDGLSTMS